MSDEHMRTAESLGAYALGALSPPEVEEVEAHLGACARCRDDLAELRTAADLLAMAAPVLVPPPELKGRVMEAVEAEAELLEAAGPQADRPQRRQREGLRRLFPRPVFTAAAAAVAMAAGIAFGVVLAGDAGQQPAGRVLAARVTDPVLARRSRASVELSDGRARLVVQGLPEPPRQRVYQVWIKAPEGAPVPGTTFAVRSGAIELSRGLRRGEAVLVTHEPVGGSRTPTRTPLIVAQPA